MLDELSTLDESVLDSRVLARSLVTLLSLTSDAVLAFDNAGRIVLANTEAERLFGLGEKGLVGRDVHSLFPPALTARGGVLEASVPFALDGTTSSVVCELRAGKHETLSVRCEKLRGRDDLFLMVAYASEPQAAEELERARLIDELSRANRRLSGTLRIVLETLDSLDVGMLFDRVLNEISETLDAWATLAYVADADGYRLRAGSEVLGTAYVPSFLPASHPLSRMVAHENRPLRLRVMRPTSEDLRKGTLKERRVVEEESLESVVVGVDALAPFPSFVLCPVWFGGHTIALLMVGWRHEHNVSDDDVRLLDAVSEYLSVQLAGAFAAMKVQHAEHLESLATQLREQLMAAEELSDAAIDEVVSSAGEGVEAHVIKLAGNSHQRTTVAKLPQAGWNAVPVDLARITGGGPSAVVTLPVDEALTEWLDERGLATTGAVMALSGKDGAQRGYLLLRQDELGPFEDADLSFLRTLSQDIDALNAGEQARTRDKRISQALQRGMRNELQRVDGISSESCYCSATEEAYVGGDFYDLVRLPERRSCVIMGDVSGKGVEAASVSSAVKTALGAYAWEGLAPARMVSLLNDFLLGFSRVETFATLFVGIVDLSTGRLSYCSAGHPPALLVRAGSGELVTLGVQSGVVGAFEGLSYADGHLELKEGDVLLLYTDGTTEARNPQGAFFGEDGLREAVSREAAVGFAGICDRLLSDVEDFAGGTLGDDVALVAVRFDAVGE